MIASSVSQIKGGGDEGLCLPSPLLPYPALRKLTCTGHLEQEDTSMALHLFGFPLYFFFFYYYKSESCNVVHTGLELLLGSSNPPASVFWRTRIAAGTTLYSSSIAEVAMKTTYLFRKFLSSCSQELQGHPAPARQTLSPYLLLLPQGGLEAVITGAFSVPHICVTHSLMYTIHCRLAQAPWCSPGPTGHTVVGWQPPGLDPHLHIALHHAVSMQRVGMLGAHSTTSAPQTEPCALHDCATFRHLWPCSNFLSSFSETQHQYLPSPMSLRAHVVPKPVPHTGEDLKSTVRFSFFLFFLSDSSLISHQQRNEGLWLSLFLPKSTLSAALSISPNW